MASTPCKYVALELRLMSVRYIVQLFRRYNTFRNISQIKSKILSHEVEPDKTKGMT